MRNLESSHRRYRTCFDRHAAPEPIRPSLRNHLHNRLSALAQDGQVHRHIADKCDSTHGVQATLLTPPKRLATPMACCPISSRFKVSPKPSILYASSLLPNTITGASADKLGLDVATSSFESGGWLEANQPRAVLIGMLRTGYTEP
jgi:hypothetical protein